MRTALRNFTLIEMLVIVAIISILAAMMSPSLQKALASARQVACSNNLKQVSTAMSLYAGDHVTYPAAWPRSWDLPFNQHWWYFRLLPYSGQSQTVKNWTDAAQVRISGIFNCPETVPVPTNDDCHFSLNTFTTLYRDYQFAPGRPSCATPDVIDVGTDSIAVSPDARARRQHAGFAAPAPARIVFVSELGWNYDADNVRSPHIRCGGLKGYMDQVNGKEDAVMDGFKAAFRHNGRKNVLWFDLHVSTVRRYDTNYYLVYDPENHDK